MKFRAPFHPFKSGLYYYRYFRRYFILLFIINYLIVGSAEVYALEIPVRNETDSLRRALLKVKSPREKILTLTALGNAYYSEADLEKALKTGFELFEVISKHGIKVDSAKCFRLNGLVYLQKAWYDKALDNLMMAQQLFGEAGDSALQAKALMNIGIVHDCMHNLPMSLAYYNKALAYFRQTENDNGIADCELNIAIVLTKQKEYEKACENLISAAGIYERTGKTSNLAIAYINLGLTYKKLGNYALAIDFLSRANEIWELNEDEYHNCFYHLNMGEIMLDLKKNSQAFIHLEKAEKLAKKSGSKDLEALAYEYLSDYNAAIKNYKTAYTYLSKSKQLGDSLLNAETTEKVNQIQYQYEIAKRDVENDNLERQNLSKELELSKKNMTLYILSGILVIIALLVLLLVNQNRIKLKANMQLEVKNNLIGSQKDELIKLNASKDKFLSILAHDIKNPLSSIYGISEILVKDYDTLTAEEKLVFTRDIHTLSVNLFEIINTLLTWSISQSGLITHRPKPFIIGELCTKTINTLETVAKQKNIKLLNKAERDLSLLADENMIYSVLHNLINNAIKFSHPGTEVRIETARKNGFAEISVIDSGMGLSPESISKLFYYDQHFISKGTAGESGSGLGLILCKDFVEMNGGKISVNSALHKGSTFVFTLPVA